MRSILFTGALSLLLLSQSAFSQSVATRLVKITESPSKSLATIEIHNLQGKGLKSFKAMLVLKDTTGKVVDVQSRWLYGATPDEKAPAILANNKKTEVGVALSTVKPFKQIDIIPSRIILEDGSVVTPIPPSNPTVPAKQ
jgi:hypothetical protein